MPKASQATPSSNGPTPSVAMTATLLIIGCSPRQATLGRLASPRHDRLPLRAWTVRDVVANVVRGARSMHELDAPRRRIFETQLDALTRSTRRPPAPPVTRFRTHPEHSQSGVVGTD